MSSLISHEEHLDARAPSKVIEGPKPAPPEMVCTCPDTMPGLTTGSSLSLATRPGHDMRKKASVGAMEAARPSARATLLKNILKIGMNVCKMSNLVNCKERWAYETVFYMQHSGLKKGSVAKKDSK
jgi:hypothetical protein